MSRIVKVSFEVTDNAVRGDFREFIKELVRMPDVFSVYIISNDDTSAYINSIGTQLGIESSKVFIVNFTQDKIDSIESNKIDIHLDNLIYVATAVENTSEAYGLFVNELPNKYYVQPSYVVEFWRLVERIRDGEAQC